jgi:hypothetical protein
MPESVSTTATGEGRYADRAAGVPRRSLNEADTRPQDLQLRNQPSGQRVPKHLVVEIVPSPGMDTDK